MLRNKTARQHNFATVPRADIPRSKFPMRQTRKMGFNASELVPIMCEQVLPGDVWQHTESIVARFATPIAPAVDDIDLETWYFFVPNRLTWPGDNDDTSFEAFITGRNGTTVVPRIGPDNDGGNYEIATNSLLDHFGLPLGIFTFPIAVNALPITAYFLIHNEWFRDQNLQEAWDLTTVQTPGTYTYEDITKASVPWDGTMLRVNKRHDYFTSSLPWPQKGDAVQLPLGTTAPVIPSGTGVPLFENNGGAGTRSLQSAVDGSVELDTPMTVPGGDLVWDTTSLQTDLSAATAATINAIRLAFQTQKLLERDARGGSRYVEQLMSHFGVRSQDERLQRPEYLGGSKIPVNVNPVAQTAAYNAEPADAASAVGNLGAEMHATGRHRTFTYATLEHGYIIGLAAVRATPTYQQGIRRHWLQDTRLSFYFPVFAMLGEQAVHTREIYQTLNNVFDNEIWGYQERWAENRYTPNEITGLLRSTADAPLDWWHYAEEFENEPALNDEFIQDKTQETLTRSQANAPSAQWSCQIIMDIQHDSQVARLMPTYSVPGLIDHF